jgi:hypothetical protein
MRILSNRKIIKDPVSGENINAFIDNKKLDILKKNCYYGVIKRGMQFRPDLVAEYYLGNAYDSWIISYVNEFVNGIEDYTLGRTIKIPVLF